ncbi:tetratricopeptide repeat protein [Streptomyces filipinensis]|uniref:tetratricopeptide repeat protein n=1 Tax=Streptomyces filipinensis TaxID=66887 RepID=UPI00178568BE|nr:tetratricopeptide repeat protein [Streptomyces filipinensis]
MTAGPGETTQDAVLNYLHRLVLATGYAVAATVHDERIGYSTPIQVAADGSSAFAGEPVLLAGPISLTTAGAPAMSQAATPAAAVPAAVPDDPHPGPGKATRVLRAVPDPAPEQSVAEADTGAPAASPVAPQPVPYGAAAETTAFAQADPLAQAAPPGPAPAPAEAAMPAQAAPAAQVTSAQAASLAPVGAPVAHAATPPPQDAVPAGATAPSLLAEPVRRINEAVGMGRIESAAAMAEQTIASAAQALGADHPEVLQLRELAAYIAFLAGDARRSFALSMEVAQIRRRHNDERALTNVQSAAAAWRGVRDPALGLALGQELIALWGELAAGGGPAAADPAQLEAARARMGRLAERARARSTAQTPTGTPHAQGR